MAAGKEIRGKIKSFENTKKITKAMEMVSVAKMRKAQERMRAARPYAEKVRSLAANLAAALGVAAAARPDGTGHRTAASSRVGCGPAGRPEHASQLGSESMGGNWGRRNRRWGCPQPAGKARRRRRRSAQMGS